MFDTYVRTFGKTEQKATNFVPDFGDFVFTICLDSNHKKQEIYIDNQRHENNQDVVKTAFLAAQ
jgi:hypothetical protein